MRVLACLETLFDSQPRHTFQECAGTFLGYTNVSDHYHPYSQLLLYFHGSMAVTFREQHRIDGPLVVVQVLLDELD